MLTPNVFGRLRDTLRASLAVLFPGGASLAAGPINIAVIGASRSRQNNTFTSANGFTRTYSNSIGFTTWAEALDNRIRFTVFTDTARAGYEGGLAFGLDGEGMTQMLANVPRVLASDAQFALFDSSVGDVGNSTVDAYCAKAQDIITRLRPTMRARGGDVIWNVLIDRGLGAGWGATGDSIGSQNHAQAAQIRARMISWCNAQTPPVPCFDSTGIMLDSSTPDNMPFPAVFRPTDKTHYSPPGGKRSGIAFINFLATLIAPAPAYDPSASGNLITNPGMTGTSGTILSGFVAGSTAPDGTTLARVGSTTTATVTTSVGVQNGRRGLIITVDRSTMTGTGLSEGVRLTIPHSTMANNLWWRGRARLEQSAASGIREISCRVRDNTGSESFSYAMIGINDGGTPSNSTDSLYQDTTPTAITPTTQPISFANAAGATFECNFYFDKGDGAPVSAFFAAPELRQVDDPHLLGYDESKPLGTTITSANAFSFPGDGQTIRSIQLAGSKLGTWAITGADAASWSVDVFGLATRATPLNYGSSDSADGSHVDQITATLTPFDLRDSPVSQAITVTASFADTGFSDAMGTAYAASSNIETANTSWTSDGNNSGGIQYTGSASNGIKLTNTTAGLWFAPQQGDTVEQRVAWTIAQASTTAGLVAPLAIDLNNYIGVTTWTGTGITVAKKAAGASSTQAVFTPYKGKTEVGDQLVLQIRNISGVYTLECFQNGVQLALASGSADVTSLVSGSGALAAARKSAIGTRSSSAGVAWIRKWNSIRAFAQVSKNYLKALTWTGGATSFTATSGNNSSNLIANRTAGSSISFGTVMYTPSGGSATSTFAGTLIPDGDTLRWDGLASGSYAIPVIEGAPDSSYAAPNPRTSNLILVIP